MSAGPAWIAGAYAALEPGLEANAAARDARGLYAELARPGAFDGLELPYRSALPDLSLLDGVHFSRHVITAIPGTMQRLAHEPNFGLASPDERGRQSALDFTREIVSAARQLHATVIAIEVHSAPTDHADAAAFAASLDTLMSERIEGDPEFLIEHCDAVGTPFAGEKRFLSLEDEVRVAKDTGVGVTINWGRSALETRNASTPLAHVRLAAEAGVLRAFMASGAGAGAPEYGAEWSDAHLPHVDHESSSLLTDDALAQCIGAASSGLLYAGVKIQTPRGLTAHERSRVLARVAEPIRSAFSRAG